MYYVKTLYIVEIPGSRIKNTLLIKIGNYYLKNVEWEIAPMFQGVKMLIQKASQ